MMQAFRSLAGKFAAAVFAILMLVFLWTSVDWSQVTGGSRTVVGEINGVNIQLAAYSQQLQSAIEQQQRATGRTLTAEEIEQVRDEVWRQLVAQISLEKEYEERGIQARSDEVAMAIQESPPQQLLTQPEFQTDGKFDITKYQSWLRSSAGAQYIPYLKAQYEDEIRRSKLLRVVTADVYVSDAGLWQAWRDANEKVTAEVTAILPRNAVPDSSVTVTEQETQAYFDSHRDDFKRPATAFMSYVSLPRFPDASDSAAALTRVMALRQEILDGAPFSEVATRESADSVSAANGGDLGEFGRGSMDPAFEKAAFSLPVGAVSEPVLSAFGYHLIKVVKRSGDKVSARHILIPVEITGAHRDQLDARADSLEALAAEQLDPAAFDSAASRLHLRIGQANPLQKGSRAQVGLQLIPDAGVWAFQAQVGETGRIIELSYAFFLFRLDSLIPERVPPFQEVRAAVEIAARDQKKWDVARTIGADLMKRLGEGSSLTQAATALGLPHEEVGPFTRINPAIPVPRVIGAAFGLDVGKTSGLIEGDQGLYVLKVLKREAADSAEFLKQIDDFRVRQINLARQGRVRNYVQDLEKNATIVDRRSQIFRTEAQAEAQSAKQKS
jgi:peptidyl-prolyl cis-trans isomerase D